MYLLTLQAIAENIKEKFVKSDKVSTLEIKEKRVILGEGKVKIINKTICNEFNIEKNILFQTRRGVVNVPRLFAMSLSRELSGLSFSEIAKKYKIKSYKTKLQIILPLLRQKMQQQSISHPSMPT